MKSVDPKQNRVFPIKSTVLKDHNEYTVQNI